jgi:hypothetical protein
MHLSCANALVSATGWDDGARCIALLDTVAKLDVCKRRSS